MKERLDGLHFFAMSHGEYSDYRVNGFYACDHPVTQAEWQAFSKAASEVKAATRAEMVTARHPHKAETQEEKDLWHVQFNDYLAWSGKQPTPEQEFAALHNMVALEYEELYFDY